MAFLKYFVLYMVAFTPFWYKLTELYRAKIGNPIEWQMSSKFDDLENCFYTPNVAWHVYVVKFNDIPGSIDKNALKMHIHKTINNLPINITYNIYDVFDRDIKMPSNQKNLQTIMNEYTHSNLFADNVVHTILFNTNQTESQEYLRIPRWGSIHTQVNYENVVDSLFKIHCKSDLYTEDEFYRQYIDYYGKESYELVQSLQKLVADLFNMIVPDIIADLVDQYRFHMEKAKNTLDLKLAVLEAGKAYKYAYMAYYHPSITSVQTYPDEHKFAIYLPFVLPFVYPILATWYEMVFSKEIAQ
eukprot:NODE_607_length_6164_cov_0.344930.p3 type:complete len:300 gc:universal NODE_607_length_6164_cov_0.344930:5981-5082(-)